MPGRDDPACDPLYKIRPLIDSCQQIYSWKRCKCWWRHDKVQGKAVLQAVYAKKASKVWHQSMASKYGWQLIQKPAMSVTMISTWGNHSQVTRGGRKQGIKLKAGKKRQLQKGTMLITLWYDKRQVAVLSSNCNPNEQITIQRDVSRQLYMSRRLRFWAQSTFTITAWVELTWMTSIDHITHLVVQVKNGGSSYFGSLLM